MDFLNTQANVRMEELSLWMGEDTLGNSGKGPSPPLSTGLADVQTIYTGSLIPSEGAQSQQFYKFTSLFGGSAPPDRSGPRRVSRQ